MDDFTKILMDGFPSYIYENYECEVDFYEIEDGMIFTWFVYTPEIVKFSMAANKTIVECFPSFIDFLTAYSETAKLNLSESIPKPVQLRRAEELYFLQAPSIYEDKTLLWKSCLDQAKREFPEK